MKRYVPGISGSALDSDGWGHDCICVMDRHTSHPWQGNGTRAAYYKTWESAQRRADSLNAGEFESQGEPYRRGHRKDKEGHWARIEKDGEEVSDGFHILDTFEASKDRRYNTVRVYDWSLIKINNLLEAIKAIPGEWTIVGTDRGSMGAEEWVAQRLGFHETIKECFDDYLDEPTMRRSRDYYSTEFSATF